MAALGAVRWLVCDRLGLGSLVRVVASKEGMAEGMAKPVARPAERLQEHVMALEAAMTACLGDPSDKAVHSLRRETRRLEAQMDLILGLPHGAELRKAAAKVLKQLKRLRGAAGRVRDLDVQRGLLEGLAEGLKAKPGVEPMVKSAEKVRRRLKTRRRKAVHRLQRVVERRQAKTAAGLARFLKALGEEEERVLPVRSLMKEIDGHFRLSCERGASGRHEKDRLHAVRKAAKVARYQAEGVPDSREAGRVGRHYEAIQAAGGKWHDWLQLAELMAGELGEGHPLAEVAARRSRKEDKRYRKVLAGRELRVS